MISGKEACYDKAIFGFPNEIFVAQLGTGAPVTGRPPGMPGFKVVRVNLQTQQTRDFLVINRPGPGGTGPARPVDAKFDPTGKNLYVVDFGVLEANVSVIIPWARSGSLWRIKKNKIVGGGIYSLPACLCFYYFIVAFIYVLQKQFLNMYFIRSTLEPNNNMNITMIL